MRCMGYSCHLLPHIPVPPFFWTMEPGAHFHEQVHKPAVLLQGSRILKHGPRYYNSLHAVIHGMEVET